MKFRRKKLSLCSLLLALFPPVFAASAAGGPDHPENAVFLPGPAVPPSLNPHAPIPAEQTFQLRHIYHHGTYRHPRLHRRLDVSQADDGSQVWLAADGEHTKQALGPLKLKSTPLRIERLKDRRPSTVDPMVAAARERGYFNMLAPSAWTIDETLGPDISSKDTVLNLALMAADAYVENEEEADWEDVGAPFNRTVDFGWKSDGLRGHIFADDTNTTIVLSLKGTSMAVFDGDGTTTNDKVNDNLFFSCCCAQQGQWTWHQVCDCATSTYSCNNTCVVQALRDENRYYAAARELYSNVTELYPHSDIWLSGHSLGGAVSSLLGLTYGLPVVTFEAVPEALAAGRLGLPVPPGSHQEVPQARQNTGAFHFGHTADPVYIGTCHGATASCSFAGYAMESVCHTGQECVYDVVADKGWRVGIGTHRIRSVINDVIMKYDDVPKCASTPECRDCANWKMYESNGTDSTTTAVSSTTTSTRTRTETCKTPGWWGCLDETTTGTSSTTTSTTSSASTTTTCLTPGWFGCKDKTSTPQMTPTSTSTSTSMATTTTTTTATTCLTPGRFWGCYDESSTASSGTEGVITQPPTATPTSTATSAPTPGPTCIRRSWFGWCKEWDESIGDWSPDEI